MYNGTYLSTGNKQTIAGYKISNFINYFNYYEKLFKITVRFGGIQYK